MILKKLKVLLLVILILLTSKLTSYSQSINEVTKALYICDSLHVIKDKQLTNLNNQLKVVKKNNRKKVTKTLIVSLCVGVITGIWIK